MNILGEFLPVTSHTQYATWWHWLHLLIVPRGIPFFAYLVSLLFIFFLDFCCLWDGPLYFALHLLSVQSTVPW